MPKIKDLTGQTFDRLTVIRQVSEEEKINLNHKDHKTYWWCSCSCNSQLLDHPITMSNLVNGITHSCGCLHREVTKAFAFTTEQFLEKALKIHKETYDYSKVVYKKGNEKICIICRKHGEFWQTPNSHINQKEGCPKCAHELTKYNSLTKEIFIERAKKAHGDKYDYSKVEYKGTKNKVCIICSVHGEFWQTPESHIHKAHPQGCSKCNLTHNFVDLTGKIFNQLTVIREAIFEERRGFQVSFLGRVWFCQCSCGKITTVISNALTEGVVKSCGCLNSIGETKIEAYFIEHHFSNYKVEYSFENLKSIKKLRFDFAIFEDKEKTKLKCLIEYDGEQHFHIIEHFGGEDDFRKRQQNDKLKNEYCKKNSIPLLRISYLDFDKIETILQKEIIEKYNL